MDADEIRSKAVELVDLTHGHTYEFCWNTEWHRSLYDEVEKMLGEFVPSFAHIGYLTDSMEPFVPVGMEYACFITDDDEKVYAPRVVEATAPSREEP